jgi:hypothetical protein
MKIIKFLMMAFALIWTICIVLVSDKARTKRILNSFKEEINRKKDKDIESG